MGLTLTVTLPLRLVSVANLREHWTKRAKRAEEHRSVVHMALWRVGQKWHRVHPVEVTITRLGPRNLDTDNLAISAKSVRDGVADALGVDDGDPRVTWQYEQRVSRKGFGVEIVVREIA